MPLIPSLNWLRVFEAAARTESFARAAEALHMSPPAVSQQIKALEGALGRPLFRRGPHHVQLTEAGQAFLPAVAEALHAVELSASSLFGPPGGASLSLNCSAIFATSWLAPRLGAFTAAHPDIRLALTTAIGPEESLRSSADLKITFGQPQSEAEDGDHLFGETLNPVAPPDLAAGIATAADLAAHPLIEIATHRANWTTLLPRDALDPRLIHTDSTQMAFALSAAGQGIALARSPASDGLQALYGLVPCLPGLSVAGVQSYSLVYPARSRLSPSARKFREWILEEVRRPDR
ncbi:MAG: LysR substrate-binding domain-containing protein [Pseudomonadota bacterium]